MKRGHCNIPRDVVRLLGTFAIVGLVGIIALAYLKVDATQISLIAGLIGPAVGALSAILSSTRNQQEDGGVQRTLITNPPSDPVPVMDPVPTADVSKP